MNIEELNQTVYRATRNEKLRAIIEDLKDIRKKSVEHSTRTGIAIIIEELEIMVEEGRKRK